MESIRDISEAYFVSGKDNYGKFVVLNSKTGQEGCRSLTEDVQGFICLFYEIVSCHGGIFIMFACSKGGNKLA